LLTSIVLKLDGSFCSHDRNSEIEIIKKARVVFIKLEFGLKNCVYLAEPEALPPTARQ
jgi:hypothetical protein